MVFIKVCSFHQNAQFSSKSAVFAKIHGFQQNPQFSSKSAIFIKIDNFCHFSLNFQEDNIKCEMKDHLPRKVIPTFFWLIWDTSQWAYVIMIHGWIYAQHLCTLLMARVLIFQTSYFANISHNAPDWHTWNISRNHMYFLTSSDFVWNLKIHFLSLSLNLEAQYGTQLWTQSGATLNQRNSWSGLCRIKVKI